MKAHFTMITAFCMGSLSAFADSIVIEVFPVATEDPLDVLVAEKNTRQTKKSKGKKKEKAPPKPLGIVFFEDSPYGLMVTPRIMGLKPGIYGMHIHQFPNCGFKGGVPGGAAGGHYDPEETGQHLGPYGKGHLGDLPPLYVDNKGAAGTPTLAPRLTVGAIKGRSLMIHEGGDNYSDFPEALGGGMGRMVCGVIPEDARAPFPGESEESD